MVSLERRRLLTAVSATTAATLAGCSDILDNDADDESSGDDGVNSDEIEFTEPESVEEAATLFVEALADDRIEEAHERIAPSVRDDIALGELEQTWMGATAAGGEFRELVETEETVEGGFDAVDVTIAFERVDDVIRVLVDDEPAVVGYRFNGTYERPDYVDTAAFEETTTTLETPGCPLPAAVTVPEEPGDVPGVVFVHGSGPADKNNENVATQLFTDLAEGLATRGVASLRYDKQTYACRVEPEDHTIDHVTVDDAIAAIEELRAVDGVDGNRIVVVGLSMGGMAAPRIAARDGDLAGAVAMAAPARSFHDVFVDQQEHLATVADHEWDAQTDAYERWADRIERVRDGDYEPGDTILGYPGALWDSLDEYHHVETAQDIATPLLFLQGDRDYQVAVEDDFELWQTELEGRPQTSFELYDDLNHLFMPGSGPSVPYEYAVRNNVPERVVTDIADWIEAL